MAFLFIAKAVSWFAIMNRFTGFGLGYIDLSSVVYYISITAVFVFLTVQSIEKKKMDLGGVRNEKFNLKNSCTAQAPLLSPPLL